MCSIDIGKIETGAFCTRKEANSSEHRPLFIGCSGGGGHNAAIESMIIYLQDNHLLTEPLASYSPACVIQQFTVMLIKIKSAAIFTNNIPILSWVIKKGLDLFKLPKLPGFLDLKEEVKKIHDDQLMKGTRHYVDMLLDVFPASIGYYYVAIWNLFQKRDQTEELKKVIALKNIADIENHQHVFKYFLNMLNQGLRGKPYTEIISTQAIALPAVCDAVKEYNVKNGTHIKIHQYLTDLPTMAAVHFFKTFTHMNSEQAKQLYLYGVNLKENFDDIRKKFFLEYSFAKLINIDSKNNPLIRPGFKNKKLDEIKIEADIELSHQVTNFPDKKIVVKAYEKVASIMLGSQASNDTYSYAIQLAQKKRYDKIFVFGGTNRHIKEKLIGLNNELKEKIILLDYQDDDHIASIMTRSNLIIIRGGGLTVMEQMAMPHHHSEQIVLFHCKRNKAGQLTSGIPWEDENVNLLMNSLSGLKKVVRTSVTEFIDEL